MTLRKLLFIFFVLMCQFISAQNDSINNLKEVRIIPNSNYYVIEIINEILIPIIKEDSKRIIGIDLGVNNFATIANNIGLTPIIIKGGILKSKNQKLKANPFPLFKCTRTSKLI